MSEIRYNNQGGLLGTTLDAPVAGTSETVSGLFELAPDFATLSGGDYIKLVLDPGTGSFEIVYLTAYTSGSVNGTITRAAEDSTNWPPAFHGRLGVWGNVPSVADFSGSSGVQSVVAGTNVTVDDTDPLNPVVSASGSGGGAVDSVNGQTGVVVLTATDVSADASGSASTAQSNAESFATSAVGVETTRAEGVEATLATSTALSTEVSRAEAAEALLAPLASPALTGTPTAPTKTALTSSTDIATTAYADAAVGVETTRATTAEGLKAPLASPALTGNPTAPTQTTGDTSTKIATDAFVSTAVGVETTRAEAAEGLLAPLASPALTGSPTAPTKTPLTSNTQLATTAYADAAVAAAGGSSGPGAALYLRSFWR